MPNVKIEFAVDFDTLFDGVLDMSEYRLSTYAVTGLSLAVAEGMTKEASDVVGGGRWVTEKDDKVCEACSKLDGQWMSAEEFLFTVQDIHPNCRCIELFDWEVVPEAVMVQEKMMKGGVGSGRYPKGSGREKEEAVLSPAENKAKELGILKDITGDEVRGFLTPNKKYIRASAVDGIYDHTNLARAIGFNNADEAIDSGLVRIIHNRESLHFEVRKENNDGYDTINHSLVKRLERHPEESESRIYLEVVSKDNISNPTFTLKDFNDEGFDIRNHMRFRKSDKVVAVDYHGTIMVENKVNKKVKEKLQEMREAGYHIIVYTAGITKNPSILNGINTWLTENSVPYDEVWARMGKPDADIYIDDKSVNPNKEDIAQLKV